MQDNATKYIQISKQLTKNNIDIDVYLCLLKANNWKGIAKWLEVSVNNPLQSHNKSMIDRTAY